MIEGWVLVLTFLVALGSGLMGGVFFAFSSFVMTALQRLPAAQGIAAMQSINVAVINPVFMTGFLGTAIAAFLLAVSALWDWGRPGGGYLLAGSLLYLSGTFLVTLLFNVPRNDALAAVDPASDTGDALWRDYVETWTAWTHVRAAAAIASSAVLILAVLLDAPGPAAD